MKTLSIIKKSNGFHWVGDGFPVHNLFSYQDIAKDISPFLLLDYAGPWEFSATKHRRGVGAHPHRGFETVTIVYSGEVEHRDSAGGGGIIGPDEVQWMTAGAGIIHEEFHTEAFCRHGGAFEVVQLWVNLPAKHKLVSPRYQSLQRDTIPQVASSKDLQIRVIAGSFNGQHGPAQTHTAMDIWDMRLANATRFTTKLREGYHTAILVLEGSAVIDKQTIAQGEVGVLSSAGETLTIESDGPAKWLLMHGEPINEPIVGYGPFVMNTETEIRQAYKDYQNGLFAQLAPTNNA